MIGPPGPTPKRPRSGGRRRPAPPGRGLRQPEHPTGPTRARCGGSTPRRWPPTSPSSTMPAGPPRVPRWRSLRRASARSSQAGRARPVSELPGCSPGYRRTDGDRGRGQARPFGVSDLAAVLATCHRPRRRGRGVESEAVTAERGRLDAVIAGLLFMAGMRRSEVSVLRWADAPIRPTATVCWSPCAAARRIRRAR